MQQLAETYAAEICVLCVHRLGGRSSILETAANPFALARGLANSLVAAALDVDPIGPSLSDRFGALGVRARERGLTELTLIQDVGELLGTADLYLSHAAPALLQTTGWAALWLAVNDNAVRAAVYGFTKRALSFKATAEADEHLPVIKRLRRELFAPFSGDPDEAVRSASHRLDVDVDAVIGMDTSGTILCWNAQAETRYGRPQDLTLGRNVLDITPAVNSRATSEVILRGAIDGQPWSGPFTVRDASGRPMRVLRTDTPVRQLDRVVGVVGLRRFGGAAAALAPAGA